MVAPKIIAFAVFPLLAKLMQATPVYMRKATQAISPRSRKGLAGPLAKYKISPEGSENDDNFPTSLNRILPGEKILILMARV
jgi:hypothetical protein